MATQSSTVACKIPWTEEPGGSKRLQRVGHDYPELKERTGLGELGSVTLERPFLSKKGKTESSTP